MATVKAHQRLILEFQKPVDVLILPQTRHFVQNI
jgi:hypothetical protein